MKKTKLREVTICRDCGDSKVCPTCNGATVLEVETKDDEMIVFLECGACFGTGRCPWCEEDA